MNQLVTMKNFSEYIMDVRRNNLGTKIRETIRNWKESKIQNKCAICLLTPNKSGNEIHGPVRIVSLCASLAKRIWMWKKLSDLRFGRISYKITSVSQFNGLVCPRFVKLVTVVIVSINRVQEAKTAVSVFYLMTITRLKLAGNPLRKHKQ